MLEIRKAKINFKLKNTEFDKIFTYVLDFKDHLKRCEEMVHNNQVSSYNLEDFIKWFDWLDDLAYDFEFKYISKNDQLKFERLNEIYIDAKAEHYRLLKETQEDLEYLKKVSRYW